MPSDRTRQTRAAKSRLPSSRACWGCLDGPPAFVGGASGCHCQLHHKLLVYLEQIITFAPLRRDFAGDLPFTVACYLNESVRSTRDAIALWCCHMRHVVFCLVIGRELKFYWRDVQSLVLETEQGDFCKTSIIHSIEIPMMSNVDSGKAITNKCAANWMMRFYFRNLKRDSLF